MKKILLILLLVVSTYASIGNITAMKGDIQVNGDKANYQTKLEKNDFIKTGKHAKVQIRFNDGTIFTLGKNSTLDIEEFLYDENQPRENKAKFNVLKGAFSSITGRIGKLNKEKFKLRTKSASIGIRGTIVVANQEVISCVQGEITVTTLNGITINVPSGYKTDVSSGTPSKVSELTSQDTRIIKTDLMPTENMIKEEAKIPVTELPLTPREMKTFHGYSIGSNGQMQTVTIDTDTEDWGSVNMIVDESVIDASSTTWGHWVDEPNKYWVAGQTTSINYLDNLRNSTNTVQAQYNGKVKGNVVTGSQIDNIKMDNTNNIKINFELGGGRNSMSGIMNFETEKGQKWSSNFNGSTIGNMFKNTSVSGTVGDRAITSGSVQGNFYGDTAQEVGGAFKLKTGDSTANGVFKASK